MIERIQGVPAKFTTPDQIECPILRELATMTEKCWADHPDTQTEEYLAKVRAGLDNDRDLAERIVQGILAAGKRDDIVGAILIMTAFEIEVGSDTTDEVICVRPLTVQ